MRRAATGALALALVATSVGAGVHCRGAEATEAAKPVADEDFPYPLAITGPTPAPVIPPTESELQQSIARGVDFLVESQRKSGAWGGPQRTKELNIYAPVPGAHLAFRTGVTALAIEALIDARELFEGDKRKAIEAAIDRGQAWMLDRTDELRRAEAEAVYNVWGHAYALHALAGLHQRAEGDEELQKKLVDLVKYHVERLERYTFVNGGWGYYDFDAHTRTPSGSPNSFVTATVLIALKKVEPLGVEYPAKLEKKAIDSILRQRYPDFSYAYGEYLRMMPRMDINRPGGSLGRTQACNLALRWYGDELITDEVIKTWLDRLSARNGWLSVGRKRPIPHESHFSVAGYFYYYGHYYAAMCIDELPKKDRPYFQDHLARILMPLQEKDGSWWDYPLYDYHQAWGTAMTVSALVRCRHDAQ
jgi:hypothetical protein